MLAPVLYEVELKRNKQRMERTEGVMVAEVDGEEWRWELQLRGEGYALSHSQMRISNHKFSACSWPGLDCEGRCRLPDPFFFFKMLTHQILSLTRTQTIRSGMFAIFPPLVKYLLVL